MRLDYLINFKLSSLPEERVDLLVLGSGVAGLSAALAAARRCRVAVVCKGAPEEGNTFDAQGGIASALPPEDTWRAHRDDTIAAGDGLCDPAAVEILAREGPESIRRLIGMGAVFDHRGGRLHFTREAAHRRARIVHARGDATGQEVEKTLLRAAGDEPRIRIWEGAMAVDLLRSAGRCRGALVAGRDGSFRAVLAGATVLASGGLGNLYRETTNSRVATGDGMAMAWRSGATLMDMEFIQFHPTTLYLAGAPRFLISEAVRGEGGVIRDRFGRRFMPEYHPAAELAPRDVVSRALVRQIRETGSSCAYLDLRRFSRGGFRRRFPTIFSLLEQYGLDPGKDLIPIRPAAHYAMGGVKTDIWGRTDLDGLYACGETACAGVHGANRLASNSLLEGLVFGSRAGRRSAAERKPPSRLVLASRRRLVPPGALDIEDLRRSLRSLVWMNAGIERTGPQLKEALERIVFWQKYALRIGMVDPPGWELQNMLIVAELLVRAARCRTESRGGHFRSDYPRRDDPNWRKHIELKR